MRKAVAFLLVILCFVCNVHAEDIDLFSMSSEEIADYISNAPLPDIIYLSDKYNLSVGDYLMSVYNEQISDWRSMSDPSIFLTYCMTSTVMQERDLMQYLPLMSIDNLSDGHYDFHSMSYDDLLALQKRIQAEMNTRSQWPDATLNIAQRCADQYQTDDVVVTSVKTINSEVLGRDVCFIIELKCAHTDTALQFSHLNEVMLNICKSMSSHGDFDCVSFTVKDKFTDKYGNTKQVVSITASYKVSTLRLINYDYHMAYKYVRPTAYISCADSYYIHPGYDIE